MIQPEYDSTFDVYMPVSVAQVKKAIEDDPEIDAIYITSPSFEGLVAEYSKIRDVIGHRYLLVDEAHGASFYFSDALPSAALANGADVTVCSVHKTLGSISATALINVSKTSRIPA